MHKRRRVDVYLDEPTSRAMHARFGYCFVTPPGSEYPPILTEHRHGAGPAGDHRRARAARSRRCRSCRTTATSPRSASASATWPIPATSSGLPAESVAALAGLDVWIVDALRNTPHPSHFSLAEALDWIERLKPKRAILTNLHTDLDYARSARALPPDVEPAYDGMSFSVA